MSSSIMEDPKYHRALDEGKLLKASGATRGMEGGAGEYSYARNSRVQSLAVEFLQPILMEEIGQLNDLFNDGSTTVIHVADLGCSVGANTLSYADILFRCIRANFQGRAMIPDIQYFFSDLPSNDFNTLFLQLQEHELMTSDSPGKNFFAAAVPGSFFGRLFPAGQLHVVISTFALQWLSEIPATVKDKTSPAYNKGRAWIQVDGSPAVIQAFAQTSKHDLHAFFQSRAAEVASGGLLVIGICGRADDSHPEQQWVKGLEYAAPFGIVFEETWKELAAEGIIDKEAVNGFNVPVFGPSLDEVRNAVESTQAFHIKRLLIQEIPTFPETEEQELLQDPEAYGRFATGFTRSLIGSYVEAHLGPESGERFFERYCRRAAMAAMEKKIPRLAVNCQLVVLVRK